MGAFVVPLICARCGSEDVQWLGETRASTFVCCSRCKDVWRLDRRTDREGIRGEREVHAVAALGRA